MSAELLTVQTNSWNQQQQLLRNSLILNDDQLSFDPYSLDNLHYIGGVDLSFVTDDNTVAVACLIVMTYPDLKIVHRSFLKTQLHLPYISGYLAFREVEPLLQLLNELKSDNPSIYPQVVLVDGNGLLHPRQFGIACHLGVSASVPTIGVAKKFMHIPDELENMSEIKEKSKRMLQKKGDHFILQGKTTHTVYGAVLRSSNNASNPIFVSQGHLISLETAIHITLESSSLYRIPDPIRSADLESRAYIREHYCISK